MGPYDLGRRRIRERQLLRSGWRKGPQPRGIRDAKARAERSVGYACLRRRTGSGTPHGSTGSDGSAGPRVLGRAQSSAAHGRIRGLPSSTRGRSRMDERPCPDLRGGCAGMRIPTVTCARRTGRRQGVKVPWNEGVPKPRFSASRASVPVRGQAKRRQRCGWVGLMSTEKTRIRGAEVFRSAEGTIAGIDWVRCRRAPRCPRTPTRPYVFGWDPGRSSSGPADRGGTA